MSRRSLVLFLLLLVSSVRADDWPQWLGPRRDGVWREDGLIEKFPAEGPRVLWRAPVSQGYAGPAVADKKVYVMDWVRTTGEDGKPLRATRQGFPGKERLLCLDSTSGKVLWKHEYDRPYKMSYPNGPRCTPIVRDGKVWILGGMGDLQCLDSSNGKVLWSRKLLEDYKAPLPAWGFAAHPLLDGDRLICLVGGQGSAAVAFHKDTGVEVWKGLDAEEVGYAPPTLVTVGKTRQVIIWTGEALHGLDPNTGTMHWRQPYPVEGPPKRPVVTISTPLLDGDRLYVTSAYHGGMMLRLHGDKPGATVLWRGMSDRMEKPDGLHALMMTPVLKGGHIYGICAMGELRCLEAATGKQVWESLDLMGGKQTDCGSAFFIPQGDRFVVVGERGDLILANLSPKGYREISRAKILEPTHNSGRGGRMVVWSHPAFANRCVFLRNDKELVCVSLAS